MRHVFVETNWVVDFAAPAHAQVPAALALAQKAEAGDVRLYIPSVCLTEAQLVIRTKFQPRAPADAVRRFVGWARSESMLKAEECDGVFRVLDRYESTVRGELDGVEARLQLLRARSGIEVFPLSDEMLLRALDISTQRLDLKPFDQAILAAVLVRAEDLRIAGADDISFCELDGDLQPWDKNGRAKQPLCALYDTAGVWVYGDFALESPPRRASFPET